MDVTTKAVALKATDYKENDKLVCLYSLEQGKISVHAKGVRKVGAKLKFACDQFCFGQYELAQNGTRFTLKTCEQLHSFYELREDVFAYFAACVIAECIVNYTEEGEADAGVFVTLLKALEQLLGGVNALLITLKFILEFLKLEGFSLDFSKCSVCGASNVPLFLDSQRGGVVCDGCRSADSVRVDSAVVSPETVSNGKLFRNNFCVPKGTHFLCTVVYLLYTMRAQRAIKQACTIHSCMFAVKFHSALHPACKMPLTFTAVLPFGVC